MNLHTLLSLLAAFCILFALGSAWEWCLKQNDKINKGEK